MGVVSFVHGEDAADAVVAALEHEAPGPVYNVCDDEPFPVARFLDIAALALGVRPPRAVPAFLVRLVAPLFAEGAFTRLALSNARVKAELGWRPRFPSPRDGVLDVAKALGREARA
jgi:nucleoside-diphosphate-sugar epimerase